MKKLTIVLLFLSICLGANSRAQASSCSAAGKLVRGVITVATSPLEIPKQARAYWLEGAKKTPHVLVWIFCGAVKGMVNMTVRIASGVWDVVSFPVPIPKDYKPLVDLQKLY